MVNILLIIRHDMPVDFVSYAGYYPAFLSVYAPLIYERPFSVHPALIFERASFVRFPKFYSGFWGSFWLCQLCGILSRFLLSIPLNELFPCRFSGWRIGPFPRTSLNDLHSLAHSEVVSVFSELPS